MSEPRAAGWALVDADGRKTTLSPMNLTVGGTLDSDVTIEGAEKNHALLIYSAADNKYKIQDLDSVIGTYVNDSRIPPEIPVTLDNMDNLTFGEDAMTYRVEQILENAPNPAHANVMDVTHNNVTETTRSNVTETTQHDEREVPRPAATDSGVKAQSTPKDMPSWATREQHNHHLAECPGCIAEQEIKHTCGGHDDSSVTHSDCSSHAHHTPRSSVPHNHTVPAPTSQPYVQHSTHPHSSHIAHYPTGHSVPYPAMDYRGYPPPAVQNGGDDDEENKVYMYASSQSSSYTTQQYGFDHSQPPSTSRSHEAAQSQIKRSKSAHFEYELQSFAPYPGDPYHYSRVYPPGYPHAFHPQHHPPHGYYPPPSGHPGFAPYDGRAYPPPPPKVPHGCSTCAVLMAQYGYVPKEHLHDHSLRHSQPQEEHVYRDYPSPQGAPPGHQPMHNHGYPPHEGRSKHSAHPNEQLTQNTQKEAVASHQKEIAKDNKTMPSPRRETSEHSTELEGAQVSSPRDVRRHNRLSSSSDKYDDYNENDLTAGLDLSAFSGSKHQNESVFKQTVQSDATKRDQPCGADQEFSTQSNVARDSESHSNRNFLSNSMPVPFQNHSDRGGLKKKDTLSNSLPISETSTSAKTRDLFARLEKASLQSSSATITVNAVSSDLPSASSVQSKHSETNIDENIPERDTNVACYNTSVTMDNNANNSESTDPPSLPRIDQRRTVIEAESTLKNNTPLYGEPEWWADQQNHGANKNADNLERPSSLVINESHDTSSSSLPPAKSMDILLSNTTLSAVSGSSDPTHTPPERDTGPVAPESTCNAPAKSSMTLAPAEPAVSPIAPADSQCDNKTPTQNEMTTEAPRRGSSMAFTIDFNDNQEKQEDASTPGAGPTAFTIDFGAEDKRPKKINMNDSLSQFLPTKVRKSFRSRSVKSKKSEDEEGLEELNDSQTGDDSSVSTPRQWNSPSTRRRSSGFNKQRTPTLTRKTGYQSDGAHSAMSSDNEDLSFRSDVITTKSSRKVTSTKSGNKPTRSEVTFSLKSPEKPTSHSNNVSSYRNKPISSSDSKMSRTARVLESMSVEKKLERRILRSKSAGISLSKNSEVTLDDSTHDEVSYTDPPPEYALYKEAKIYDKMIKSHTVHPAEPKKSPGESRPTRRSRHKVKDGILRSRSVPRVLPDDPDNISEAGTYTIDIDNREMLKARKSIDEIFNVPGKRSYMSKRATVKSSAPQFTLAESTVDIIHPVINAGDINANFEDIQHHSENEKAKDPFMPQSSQSEEVHIEISADAPSRRRTGNSLTESENKLDGSNEFDQDLNQSERTAISSASQKARRKLPSPPANKISSAEPSPRTPHTDSLESSLLDRFSDLEQDPDSPGRQRGSVTISDKDRGECFTVSFDAPQRTTPEMRDAIRHGRDKVIVDDFFGVTTPPKSRERRVRNKPDKSSSMKNQLRVQLPADDVIRHSPDTQRTEDLLDDSPRYGANLALDTGRSIDTQVLLQDTDQVMKVLEQRGQVKTQTSSKTAAEFDVFDFTNFKKKEDLRIPLHDGSDSDVSSTCALVDEDVPSVNSKPPMQPGHRTKPVTVKDRVMGRSKRSSYSSAEHYGISDDHESEESGSIASNSTDYSHGHLTTSPKVGRKNSTDKTASGRISNTRTNRAFALRRSRTETDDLDTPKTDVTTPGSQTGKSSKSQLTTAKDTSRTDVSLGTKIVQKSRENQKLKRDDTFTRKDGGRFSLRAQKSTGSLPNPNKIAANAKATADLSRPRAGRQTSLTVKGSSSKSSQPLSGKKAEEHDMWKRRSKYDPRKAIAEAKAKEQEERRQKRARSAGNTPDFDASSRSDAVESIEDTFALGAESINMSGIEDMDEITKLSSAVASDLSLLTASAQDEQEDLTQDVSFRSSAFTSVSSIRNGSAFQSPSKNITSGGLCNPVAVKASATLTQDSESYDPVLVSSIYQLSHQIKLQTEKLLNNLKEEGLQSPLDDFAIPQGASPELASTLQNLKGIEHSLKVANSHLFPASGGSSPRDPDLHQMELDRIRQELSGFKPIAITKSTPSLLSASKDVKLSASKRDPKYAGTGSMTSLTKNSSKSKTSYSRTVTKDVTRSYGHEYY